MIVVGVDPGLRACGIAVLFRADGALSDPWRALLATTVRTEAAESLHDRLRSIWQTLAAAIGKNFSLIIACEEQTGAAEGARRAGVTNADAVLVQQVVGLVRAAAFIRPDAVFVEVTPAEAKRVLHGISRTAGKAQVQRAVRAVVRDCPETMSEHASDAVAIAVAGARKACWPSALLRRRAATRKRPKA